MISIIINLDTRSGFMNKETNDIKAFSGTRSYDFISEGIINKFNFLKNAGIEDKDIELIPFIDIHEDIPNELLMQLTKDKRISSLILRRHEERYLGKFWHKWNDLNYMNALVMARGEYIMHFDGDVAAFLQDKNVIKEWKELLDTNKYDYVSYPSPWSPDPVKDPDFPDYFWASTRFIFFKREILDYTEIIKCLQDNEYLYGKYGDKKRRCPWLEHILGIIAGKGRVYYPKIETNRCLIFTWKRYLRGTYTKLMNSNYNEVIEYVKKSGGIRYPCDVIAT